MSCVVMMLLMLSHVDVNSKTTLSGPQSVLQPYKSFIDVACS